MRLHPDVSEDEAYTWLKEQAQHDDRRPVDENLETQLRAFARAMAAISRANVPDSIEPLFP